MSKWYLGLVEGEPYIIGRNGHVSLNDPYVSRKHAEIKFSDGEISLRDLSSGNGLSIYREGRYQPFSDGVVKEDDRVFIGSQSYSVYELLDMIKLENYR